MQQVDHMHPSVNRRVSSLHSLSNPPRQLSTSTHIHYLASKYIVVFAIRSVIPYIRVGVRMTVSKRSHGGDGTTKCVKEMLGIDGNLKRVFAPQGVIFSYDVNGRTRVKEQCLIAVI
ncbi:hypothetical protein PILCRDRAFT_534859 [Piloderma croceum F 1598]|uniref:Uncharacterized protein n=1 Tax=Piloderma croceum (strain F 1598) TaxID=765440 RepID=A0A0C3FKL5_PILCF|nr:hypothetical protein PILCRDRAFT_534859 [Piloderma croceum F 1598]